MSGPKRIQLRRTKGWRMPDGAVKVDRTTRWGNPYVIHVHEDHACGTELERCSLHEGLWPVDDREAAVTAFRFMLVYPKIGDPRYTDIDEIRYQLAGHDLACWCPLDAPCHADVLLDLANR